jgi:uncharacterized repeat protein (TIGR01451 family)
MTHPTNTPSSQSTVTTSSPLGRQPMRNATPTLQRLLTISTGGLLLSAIAETQAQSADFCQPEAGQLSIECADRSVVIDAAPATTSVGNQPEPDRAFDQDAQPTFSTVAATSQPRASNVMSAPTVDSGAAIAEPAIAKMQPMVNAQASPAPDAVEAASVDSAVENLQKSLNRAGFTVEVNGVFDQETQTALQQFKVQRGLGVTGIAGSPGQTSLISAMPAGYDSGQSLLLVQNTEDETTESAPESEADEDAADTEADATTPAAEEAEEASEEEASEADDSTETEAATDDTPDAADSGEDAEATDAATPETPDDNLTEEDTEAIADDESDDTAADDAPSETMDTEPTEAEATDSTDESSDAEETDDELETAPADTEEAPGRDAPADDTPAQATPSGHAPTPTPEEPVDKSGTPEVTQPRSATPTPAKKPDEPGGTLNNTATGTSRETPPQGASASVPVTSHPVFGFNKTVTEVINPDGSIAAETVVDEAGDTIKYTMRVSNLGNVTLTGVAIADPLLKANPANNVTLAVDEALFFQGEYTATQADIDGESAYIHNEATFSSDQTSPKTDGEAVPIRKIPALKVEKQATNIDRKNDGQLNAVGDIIDYSIVVTNTGNQTLTNVQVNDSLIGNQTIDQLAPNASKTFLGQYELTQQDIDSNGGGDGDIDNTVIAKADQVPPTEDFVEVDLQQNPALAIEKRVLEVDKAGDGVLNQAGEKIHYEVIVTNTGNQTLNNVIVTDPLLGGTIDEGFSLSPGASQAYELTYTVTQADLDNEGAPLNAPEFLNPSQP